MEKSKFEIFLMYITDFNATFPAFLIIVASLIFGSIIYNDYKQMVITAEAIKNGYTQESDPRTGRVLWVKPAKPKTGESK